MPEICAAVPAGFFERSRPRMADPKHAFGERPGSCVGPLGMDPPGLSPPNHSAPSPVDPESFTSGVLIQTQVYKVYLGINNIQVTHLMYCITCR
jgi:hypothetical protein